MEEDVVYVNEVDSIYNDSNIWELQTVTSSEEHQLEDALMVWSQKQQQQQQPHRQQTQLKLSQHNNNTFLFYNSNNLNATANLNLWYTENQIDSTLLSSPSSSQLSSVTTTLATLFYVNISNATIANLGDAELSTSSVVIDNTTNNHLNNYWALLALILVIGTAAGNILVCLAIAWERRLQNVTNYFLMSLAITDLMVAILVMPLGILTLVKGEFKNCLPLRSKRYEEIGGYTCMGLDFQIDWDNTECQYNFSLWECCFLFRQVKKRSNVLEIGIILRMKTMTSEQHHHNHCYHFTIIVVIIIMSMRKLPPIELNSRVDVLSEQYFTCNVLFMSHFECLRHIAIMTTTWHIVKLTLVYTVGRQQQQQQKQNEQFTQHNSYKFSFEMRKTLKLLHTQTPNTLNFNKS
uniref:G-protein coupled receptors family 1 profile domain-containing protein n=1 Tax=Glossina pallidipes TaxID=7398 RepID=A0A1A9Z501_GLOPL